MNRPGSRYVIARLAKVAWLIMHRKGMTADTLAHELGISAKTIWRDIEFLRDLGHEIEYDGPHHEYYYVKPPLSLSDPNRRCLL